MKASMTKKPLLFIIILIATIIAVIAILFTNSADKIDSAVFEKKTVGFINYNSEISSYSLIQNELERLLFDNETDFIPLDSAGDEYIEYLNAESLVKSNVDALII